MKVIEQSAEFIAANNSNPKEFIEMCGRTAYKSHDKISEGSAERFCKMIIKNGHESVLEHLVITVRLITSRGVMAELTRHRMASFTIQSTRYVSMINGIDVIFPEWIHSSTQEQYCIWKYAMKESEYSYVKLIKSGRKPEDARGVLPQDLATEIVMTCNLRELRHIMRLRSDKAAHPDMRKLMSLLRSELDTYLGGLL